MSESRAIEQGLFYLGSGELRHNNVVLELVKRNSRPFPY